MMTQACCWFIVPQVSDAMSDSTTSSTTANDLDLIYLKGIMESPLVWYTATHTNMRRTKNTELCVFFCVWWLLYMWLCVYHLCVCIRSKKRAWRNHDCHQWGRTMWSYCRRSWEIWTLSHTALTQQLNCPAYLHSLTSRCGTSKHTVQKSKNYISTKL